MGEQLKRQDEGTGDDRGIRDIRDLDTTCRHKKKRQNF